MGNNFDPTEWSMSRERELMERLLCQRFSFFLALFALSILSATICRDDTNSGVILATGFLVCLMVWMTVYRAHVEHHWIMQEIIYQTENHPAKIVRDEMKRRGLLSLFSVSRWIGVVIPAVCCGILIGGALGLFCGVL
ncbi:MAG: hypothetical protein KA354_24685 [Phycisphaerae bacterium]|nr:hypothetical protein [Phycisphaerae bacterium]